VTDRTTEPAAVLETANTTGTIWARWAWVDAAVWTERMLTALEKGVQGSKWYSLMDKVGSRKTLERAFMQVQGNDGAAGVDHVKIEEFAEHLDENLDRLVEGLREGSYQPQAIRRAWINKVGSKEKRPLGIPTVRDRVVQAALVKVLEPILERDFGEHSYGFRPKRGCKDALRRVDDLLQQGHQWIVDADMKSYFDRIPHRQLMERVASKVADGAVLDLVEAFLKAKVMETMHGWIPNQGTPQGAVLSPLLSNLYLDPLDQEMAGAGYEMVRYADDFVILCRSQAEAGQALQRVQNWTAQAGLGLHPDKTHIVDATQPGGFDFLGYHFEQGWKQPRAKSLKKFKDTIRVKTGRSHGHSLNAVIHEVNKTTRGWFEYFKHSRRRIFSSLDSWIRMRLRSILRRREGRKGRGRGWDHNRWPNAFFAEQGLFSLDEAHASARQSSPR
jgi:RNA-directed DNA polymerase